MKPSMNDIVPHDGLPAAADHRRVAVNLTLSACHVHALKQWQSHPNRARTSLASALELCVIRGMAVVFADTQHTWQPDGLPVRPPGPGGTV